MDLTFDKTYNIDVLILQTGIIIYRKDRISMDMIENEIKKATDSQCFLAALTLALTIPSVCCTHKSWGGSKIKKENERYCKWCEEYIDEININNTSEKHKLTAKEYYALRCALLHNGDDNLKSQPVLRNISDTENYSLHVPYTEMKIDHIEEEGKRFCAAPIIVLLTEAYKKFKKEYSNFIYPLEKK